MEGTTNKFTNWVQTLSTGKEICFAGQRTLLSSFKISQQSAWKFLYQKRSEWNAEQDWFNCNCGSNLVIDLSQPEM